MTSSDDEQTNFDKLLERRIISEHSESDEYSSSTDSEKNSASDISQSKSTHSVAKLNTQLINVRKNLEIGIGKKP